MAETSRHTLSKVDPNHLAPAEDAPATKKGKSSSAKILTFSVAGSPVQVQLLDSHTLYDLVDMLCRDCDIRGDETVYDHMWNVNVSGKKYESGDVPCMSQLRAEQTKLKDVGALVPNVTKLVLEYDYGTTSQHEITLVEEEVLSDAADTTPEFPRRKPLPTLAAATEFSTAEVDLNALYPTWNNWAFQEARGLSLNLFQPGRKHNYGFQERDNDGVCHMIYFPVHFGSDLADYLHALDYGSQFQYKTDPGYGGPCYNWYSMVVLPHNASDKTTDRYMRDQEVGFCECKVVPPYDTSTRLNGVFPKVAALAGYKKDRAVKKGWISYKSKTFMICSGTNVTHQSNAPRGTAYDGFKQHEPTADSVLFQIQVEIKSIHQLFCIAEGLLKTL